MDFNSLIQAISSVGFPIVMCGVMFYYLQKNDENHETQVAQMRDAINNNTIMMNKVLDKIGGDQ